MNLCYFASKFLYYFNFSNKLGDFYETQDLLKIRVKSSYPLNTEFQQISSGSFI